MMTKDDIFYAIAQQVERITEQAVHPEKFCEDTHAKPVYVNGVYQGRPNPALHPDDRPSARLLIAEALQTHAARLIHEACAEMRARRAEGK